MEISILILPLIASIISGFFGKFIGDRNSEILTSGLVSISALLSVSVLYQVIVNQYEENIVIATWINSGSLDVNWSMLIDPLSAVMVVVVTSVSSIVHIYSIGYMSHDPHKPRFMAYLSLFTFAMLMLVTSDNFIQLFFGWEGVGLCSYFLIGFWFKKESANAAAIKAFVVNRVGDFGFALGIFLIFYLFDTVNYSEVFQQIPTVIDKELSFLGFDVKAIDLICLLLFIGAMGKSAQILLHTWLPDAMEGPTPVSALIHAATMVTAGVFLVVRCSPLFDLSPDALTFITLVGATTAFFAASVGLVQNDIKRVIAYSTCSQLGYMFFAAGLGAYGAAMFHLFTHAFFKALLFLGAGSIIHAVNDEQDMRKMGGIYQFIPFTQVMMVIGTVSLMGFPFTSGFYSKDAIIEAAYLSNSMFSSYAYILGTLGVVMTSFYSWRLMFLTFNGNSRIGEDNLKKVHESPNVMLIPLFLLAIGALFFGYLFKSYFIGDLSDSFWNQSIAIHHHEHHHIPSYILYLPAFLGVLGFILAWYMYLKNTKIPNAIAKMNSPIYNFLLNKWYFDELYYYIFIVPSKALGNFFWKIIDVSIIDGFGPNGIANSVLKISNKAKNMQTGFIYHYAFAILIGLSFLITYFVFII